VQTLQVDLGHARYPITIGSGLLGDRAHLDALVPGRDLMVVTSTTVGRLYLAKVRAALGERNVAECILPDGEQHKTLQTAGWVIDELVGKKLNRDGIVLALGGGVVGDIAGFAAACYQRGIGCVQLPTTLLAQVDSSVGGKTGVNHRGGKNLIGAFHQPLAVVADIDTLSTLPDRELSAGLAEVIKYGCVADLGFLDWLDSNIEKLLDRDVESITHAIARSCEIKAAIVGEDEREHGRRAILNFGHTFGHAIEAATDFERFLHGEAVALGMVMAGDLSQALGLIDAPATRRIAGLLRRARLPTEPPKVGAARALELMRMDKKVLSGKLRLVLLERLGSGIVVSKYPQRALESTLREHFA
jgi:3-dehydroquinate synthase